MKPSNPVHNTLRGVIHVHSKYSYDCITPISTIARTAAAAGLDFVILTDHDTVAGSKALRKYVRDQGLPIEVPIAAEYYTSHGDVIAAFLEGEKEIETRQYEEFAAEVRSRGGLLLLPHPHHNHSEVEMLARDVDLVECSNGRQSAMANEKARVLCDEVGATSYHGADAHLRSTLLSIIVEVRRSGNLKKSLLENGTSLVSHTPTPQRDVFFSQLIKAVKIHSPRLFFRVLRVQTLRTVSTMLKVLGLRPS